MGLTVRVAALRAVETRLKSERLSVFLFTIHNTRSGVDVTTYKSRIKNQEGPKVLRPGVH